MSWGVPVISLFWEYPPNATARVGLVTGVAWNEVDVKVRDRLTRRSAVIDPNVEAVGRVRRTYSLLGALKEG